MSRLRIPYSILLIGLDQLYFRQCNLTTEQLAQTVSSYLEGSGWSWDDLIEEMIHEEVEPLSTCSDN